MINDLASKMVSTDMTPLTSFCIDVVTTNCGKVDLGGELVCG